MKGREDRSFQGGAGDVCSPCVPWFCLGKLKSFGLVAGLTVPVLPFTKSGDDYDCFPTGWKKSLFSNNPSVDFTRSMPSEVCLNFRTPLPYSSLPHLLLRLFQADRLGVQ